MNRYDRYPGDYVRDTLDLSLAEDGAYTRLLDWYYANERAVPDDRKYAVTRATSVDDQKITEWVLRRFFILRNGEWHHERADQEVGKYRRKIETARFNGQSGGRPRKNGEPRQYRKPKRNPKANLNHNPEANPNVTQNESLPSPSPVRISVPTEPRRVSLDPDIKRVFDSWRQDTGKHRARLDAKRKAKITARLRDGFTADELVLAITNRRNDPFLMGQNDSGRVYDDIPTLLRDVPQVERLRDLKTPMRPAQRREAPPQPSSGYQPKARFIR